MDGKLKISSRGAKRDVRRAFGCMRGAQNLDRARRE
jgi:hypothetical protein